MAAAHGPYWLTWAFGNSEVSSAFPRKHGDLQVHHFDVAQDHPGVPHKEFAGRSRLQAPAVPREERFAQGGLEGAEAMASSG